MNTPKRKIKKPTSTDINTEFSKQFLELFTSVFDTPTIDPILTLGLVPLAPSNKQTNEDTKPKKVMMQQQPLNASLWDFRLKKAVDNRYEALEKSSEMVSDELDKFAQQMETDSENSNPNDYQDLVDIFSKDQASRAEVPKYIQNIKRDIQADIDKRKHPNVSMSTKINEAEKQFTLSLQRQKQRMKDHRKKLLERQKQREKEHVDFVKTLPKSKISEKVKEQTARSEYEERMKRAKELLKIRQEGVETPKGKGGKSTPRSASKISDANQKE